ncbi:carabin-like [Oculina patagonica]
MAPVVAVLLMHMTGEEAFWCLVMICDRYIPGYYGPKLEAVQMDGAIFGGLLVKSVPHIAKHMNIINSIHDIMREILLHYHSCSQ